MVLKKWLRFCLLFFLVALVGCLLALAVSQSLVLHGPCVPFDYPSAKTTIEHHVLEVDVPLGIVADFYNEQLDVLEEYDMMTNTDGRWILAGFSENHFLYECNGVERNRLDVAIGCINIIDHGKTVTIETFFFRSGAGWLCEDIDFDIPFP